jgi:hypothetical protein
VPEQDPVRFTAHVASAWSRRAFAGMIVSSMSGWSKSRTEMSTGGTQGASGDYMLQGTLTGTTHWLLVGVTVMLGGNPTVTE